MFPFSTATIQHTALMGFEEGRFANGREGNRGIVDRGKSPKMDGATVQDDAWIMRALHQFFDPIVGSQFAAWVVRLQLRGSTQ